MLGKDMVLVAGATGYLGKHVVRALHEAGFPVRALARKAERLGDVRELCDEVVVAQA
ncbi:MAG: NmrA family NAD(P)-binding protein, partial [Deltaproteobacteria bacterium]|nr:NmrA family NAD(P)-binding protein [Deltaproteobacteria bacterium]